MAATVHVEPVGDLIAHETDVDEPSCVCGPQALSIIFDSGLTAQAFVHFSLDGRELAEGT